MAVEIQLTIQNILILPTMSCQYTVIWLGSNGHFRSRYYHARSTKLQWSRAFALDPLSLSLIRSTSQAHTVLAKGPAPQSIGKSPSNQTGLNAIILCHRG